MTSGGRGPDRSSREPTKFTPQINALITEYLTKEEAGAPREELDQLNARKSDLQNARARVFEEAGAAARDSRLEHLLIEAARDEETLAQVRQLTDGYASALSEVRPLGGALTVSERSTRKAADAFQEAAQVFPSDWVNASNARVGGQKVAPSGRVIVDRAPVAKVGRSRAHYVDISTQTTRRKMLKERNVTASVVRHYLDEEGRPNSPFVHVRPFTEQEQAEWATHSRDEPMFKMTEYEVASAWATQQGRPAGRGWEEWTYPDGRRTVWRRVKHSMREVDSTTMPEITTRAEPAKVEGRSDTFAVSAHELSHRMEATVPGIKELEEQFLTRRRTDPVTGQQEQLIRLYPRSKEFAYKDGFNLAYTGKVYEQGYREILSTGIEQVFGGSNGAGLGLGASTADPDHRNFVLGLMATIGLP